jgi:hypothetical protein
VTPAEQRLAATKTQPKQESNRTTVMKPKPTTIISLNTRWVARSLLPVPDWSTRHHVDRLVKQGSAPVPLLAGYFATLGLAKGCAQLLVSRNGKELLTAGLAWGHHDANSAALWQWLLDLRAAMLDQGLGSLETRPGPQPRTPWLTTFYGPLVENLPLFEATAIVVYQRNLMAHLSRQTPQPR